MAQRQSKIFVAGNSWLGKSLIPNLPTSCIYEKLELFEEHQSLFDNNDHSVNHFICTFWTINH